MAHKLLFIILFLTACSSKQKFRKYKTQEIDSITMRGAKLAPYMFDCPVNKDN